VLALVIVLAVLLVVIDRVAVYIADRAAADQIKNSQHLSSRPTVRIEGFPFLTQVLGSRYRAVSVKASGVTVGDSDRMVTIRDFDARLTGIDTTRDFSRATADTVRGTATVSYPELSRVIGVPLNYDGANASGAGRLVATETLGVLGASVSGSVSAQVDVVGGDRLQFSSVRVSAADAGISLPQTVTDQFASVFSRQLSLKGLPLGLTIERIVVSRTGVSIVAAGTDVPLNG